MEIGTKINLFTLSISKKSNSNRSEPMTDAVFLGTSAN
jgi:hypothetical protein